MMVSCSRTEGLVSYVLPCAHDFFEHLPKDLPLMFPFPDSFVEPCPCNLWTSTVIASLAFILWESELNLATKVWLRLSCLHTSRVLWCPWLNLGFSFFVWSILIYLLVQANTHHSPGKNGSQINIRLQTQWPLSCWFVAYNIYICNWNDYFCVFSVTLCLHFPFLIENRFLPMQYILIMVAFAPNSFQIFFSSPFTPIHICSCFLSLEIKQASRKKRQ